MLDFSLKHDYLLNILHVISSVHYHGAATQLAMLAPRLPRERFQARVCVLGRDGPMARVLRESGIAVACLGWTRLIDPRPFWRLRQQVSDFKPDVLHVWRLPALRAAHLVTFGRKPRCPIVASAIDGSGHAVDRWLLGRTARTVVSGPALAERCRRLGLPAERIAVIPPAVDASQPTPGKRDEVLHNVELALPSEARLIVGIGPFEPEKGVRDAVWAFDIVSYLYPDLHLLLIGSGPELARVRRFVRGIEAAGRVHLLGPQPDVRLLLGLADVVWVPSRSSGGVQVALEAQAAGTPVIASNLPELAEVIDDGASGALVPAGDKVALARQTRVLLDDAARRRRLGDAGRQRAVSHFHPDDLVRRFTQLYEHAKP